MEQPNHSYIDQLSAGNKAFKEKLISVIKEEFPEEKAIYLKNISAKNYKEAAENVHKIKHKISILGLEKSYEVARAFENNLKEEKTNLKDEFENILHVISEYLLTM
ncbi:Hpt domain-containing protein [uncultured Dokdonia sp.]|uniref:Hpt domain-containing protein n=1 Tax=uncultured Dokdonia sp. TaxID=575653 RepID=UPI0026118702|nr:Hpt domain-containing protein [uncultured Dokdonia sp.]